MKADILGNSTLLGFKSYCAYCSGIFHKGILSRIETNDLLAQITVNNHFLGTFISRWFPDPKKAAELYNTLTSGRYSFIRDSIQTPLFLGMVCLSVERVNGAPLHLSNFDSSNKERENWLFGVIEELIQYTPPDRLSPFYLDMQYTYLKFYVEVCQFCPSELISRSQLLPILVDYADFPDEEDMLNTIDECGVLLWVDEEHFGWSDEGIRERLVRLDYKTELWSTLNRFTKTLS